MTLSSRAAAAQPAVHPGPVLSWSVQAVTSILLAALVIRMVMALAQRRRGEVLLELPFAVILGLVLLGPSVAGSFFTHLPSLDRV